MASAKVSVGAVVSCSNVRILCIYYIVIRENQMIDWCEKPDPTSWIPSCITRDQKVDSDVVWNTKCGV